MGCLKLIKRITGLITSMKFALVILVLLAVFMIAGSFMSSDLFTGSYLFAAISVLLLISLLLCCLKRIAGIIRAERALKEKSIRRWVVEAGSPLMHIGVLLIVAGMLMGQFTGFKDDVTLTPGGIYSSEETDFGVRLDSFEIVYDDEYNITDYISTVTVIEGGEEVLTTEIAVNKPLVYDGVKFYQSTYGWAAKVKISEAETSEVLLDSVLKMPMSSAGIGDVVYSAYDNESGATVTQRFMLIPDQASEGTVNTLSPLPNNPALFFVLYYDSDIYVIEDIGLGSSEDVGGLIVLFEGLEYYTGFEVSSKPELPVVFGGSLIFIAGLIIVFYVRRGVNESQEVEDIGG